MSEPALQELSPEGEELVGYLERDQLVADTSLPVAPMSLSPRARVALWALRVFVALLAAMVLVSFVAGLR
jgi:hypothetical protein